MSFSPASLVRIAAAFTAALTALEQPRSHAETLAAGASFCSNNAILVDIQVLDQNAPRRRIANIRFIRLFLNSL